MPDSQNMAEALDLGTSKTIGWGSKRLLTALSLVRVRPGEPFLIKGLGLRLAPFSYPNVAAGYAMGTHFFPSKGSWLILGGFVRQNGRH